MTVLSAAREAAIELNQTEPTSLFSTTSTFAKELALQANRAAVAIAKAYDWQRLLTLGTLTGDASATAFDLPADFDRMPKKARVHSSSWQTASFVLARDIDAWLNINDSDFSANPGTWIIYGNQFRIFPAMPASETARFYYITNQIVSPNKTAFTADSDTFVLSERLLSLGIVWRWRAQKRMEYAEDLKNFEIALSEEIGSDRGSKNLSLGSARYPYDVRVAYPGVLGP